VDLESEEVTNMAKVGELKELIKTCRRADVPMFIWGAPGIGKSDSVRQTAVELNLPVVDLRMSLLNPIDLRGIPYIDKESGVTKWMSPSFLPREGEGILFLDELNVAPPAVQAAAYQLVLDRKVGEYTLPKGWYIVAAGNRGTDRAIVFDMPSALRNRMTHYNVEVSLDDWMDWAWSNNIDSRVISFLNFKNNLLFQFDPKASKQGFPTPRSWSFVSRLINASPKVDFELVAGSVGEAAGHEFTAFVKVMDKLPNADDIINGKPVTLPKEPSSLYALCGSLVAKVQSIAGKKHLEAIRNVVTFAEQKLSPEFAVLSVKDYARTPRFKEFSQQLFVTAEWKGFCKKFGDMILR
jgi:hypothetical protein